VLSAMHRDRGGAEKIDVLGSTFGLTVMAGAIPQDFPGSGLIGANLAAWGRRPGTHPTGDAEK
jgi:hypothetical protein